MFRTVDCKDIPQITSASNSSPSRDERDTLESTQVAKRSDSSDFTPNMLIKEMVFCVALILTAYGALHNSPTKVSKHPQAVRFFSPQSVVTDWYRGQLSHALAHINSAEISFVMYYAPWDAESQHVRDEFDKAAKILHDRIYFSAINCWNPGSECRIQNNKIPSWPILMVYTVNGRGVLYKGPRDAHSMIKFLELIMKPIERIQSTEDLVHLLSICDAVAVGYTPLTYSSKDYHVWYQVAVKSKEYDVVGELCFAAVTSEDLAADLGVETVPTARLMLWNDTIEFKATAEGGPLSWNETSLLSWVLENFAQPVARIIPLWKKAFNFERFINGPILILFTPLNPLYEQLPAYDLLREIAMEYFSCKNNETNQWTSELIKLQQVQRLLYQQKDFDKYCQDYKHKTVRSSNFYKKEVVSHNNKYPWRNVTQKSQKSSLFNFLVKRGLAMSRLVDGSEHGADLWSSLGMPQCAVFPAEKSFYDSPPQCESRKDTEYVEASAKRYWGSTETSMLSFDDDPLSPVNLAQDKAKHFCKLMKFAQEWSPIVKPEKADSQNITHIHGLSCAKNVSLNILALDSVHNHHFAESLGIDIINKKDKTAVVILDSKHESQYVLSGPYSAKSVRDFIANFTHKSLKRTLRTHVSDAAHTHYFGSEGATEQMGINDSTVHIIDLTTKTFRKVVRTPGQVTLVAVCGGACGSHTSRALVGAARLLAACGVPALPARLDALRHDLPWHYTPHAYPAILVIVPTHTHAHTATRVGVGVGEADSAAYPRGARVSASGLVALVLRSLGAPEHLRVTLALCTRAKVYTEKKTCLKDLKEHVTSVIGRNLKYWRRSEHRRLKDAFLTRLQHLHQASLHLSLLQISDLQEHSYKYSNLLNSLGNLSKHWDIHPSLLFKNETMFKQRS